jgi:MFS family permease
MRSEIEASIGTEVAKCTDPFKYPQPLIIGCGLVFLQQVTGQPSVLYFATNIFKSAGFGSSAALSSVGVGLVKLLATLFTVWRVDQYGRRFLLFVGISMMAASLALIATAFVFRECQTPGVSLVDCETNNVGLPRTWALATVAGLMVYVSGYQVGFGPISWLMISEVFPLKVRGAALSLAAVVNFGSNILMTLTSQVLQDALTPAGVFFGYLILSLASLAFVESAVPETRGKTLEEIERMLTGGKQARELAITQQP